MASNDIERRGWDSNPRPSLGRMDPVAFARFLSHRRCWSDRRQTGQQVVFEGFGVAHACAASDFDQFASEDGPQSFVVVKIDRIFVSFDRCERSVKGSFQNLSV